MNSLDQSKEVSSRVRDDFISKREGKLGRGRHCVFSDWS
jgi:hypothetical protein